MAFPQFEEIRRHSGPNWTTQHPTPMPATPVAGNLLLACLALPTSGGFDSIPSGWTRLDSGGLKDGYIFGKISDGTEGGTTPNWITNSFSRWVTHVYEISGWWGTLATGVAVNDHQSSAHDPPSLTPSWGAADTLWLVFDAVSGTHTISASPSGYSAILADQSGIGSGTEATLGSARRELNTATEDPTAFTVDPSDGTAITVAIRPAVTTIQIRGLAYNPIKDELYWINSTPIVKKVIDASIAPAGVWDTNIQQLATPAISTPSTGMILAAIVN